MVAHLRTRGVRRAWRKFDGERGSLGTGSGASHDDGEGNGMESHRSSPHRARRLTPE